MSESLELPDPAGKPWVALSRYLPRPDEVSALSDPQAAYSVETVGGWASSMERKQERRRVVRMLAEGSVLGPVERPVPGQVVDVQPVYEGVRSFGHAIWRSGLAAAVGIERS